MANKNNIIENSNLGVHIWWYIGLTCNDNLIYNNNFIGNGQSALDQCSSYWHKSQSQTGIGNYWSDWKSNPGYPNTYIIPGGFNKDYYPLTEPVDIYSVEL